MTSGQPALRVSDLRVARMGRGDKRSALVEDVCLEVREGEVAGLIGETGAGKTLTAKAILGLLPNGTVATGEEEICSKKINLATPRTVRAMLGRELAVVFQNPGATLDPLYRVGSQITEAVVRLGVMTRKRAQERGAELLSRLGFADPEAVCRLYPHQLSGGMSQRVAIAMALMPEPRILVVDEPTSALDANIRVELMTLLRRLALEEGLAILLVSHDLTLVGRFCDSLHVMYAGHILEAGPTAELLATPLHPYTKALWACSPSVDSPSREPLVAIPGSPPRPDERPSGCVFAPRCPLASDLARAQRPSLRPVGDHHLVACHLAAGNDAQLEPSALRLRSS